MIDFFQLEELRRLFGYFEELKSKGNGVYFSIQCSSLQEGSDGQNLGYIGGKVYNAWLDMVVIDDRQGNIFLTSWNFEALELVFYLGF